MFVEKWMTADPVTVPPSTTISNAALHMAQYKLRHLLVAENYGAGKKLVGLLSNYDIARAFPNDFNPFSLEVTEAMLPRPVSSIMTRDIITVTPDCAIEEAARVLRSRHVSALPVVRGANLVGIITESDIFEALLGMTGANTRGSKMVLECGDVRNALLLTVQLSDRYELPILNILSYRDPTATDKVILVFHFTDRPNADFIQEICRKGIRLLSLV
jgi:acetoin utilization protein AcuB